MRITRKGRITIPRELGERFGLREGVEVELVPTKGGILIRARHPVDRVYGVLGTGGNTDDYLEAIRGR